MIIKRVKNDKAIHLCDVCVGDTFLYQNKVCMVVDRNGHSFIADPNTGRNISVPQNAELVRVECVLEYKVL
jgi:hypothetical protein